MRRRPALCAGLAAALLAGCGGKNEVRTSAPAPPPAPGPIIGGDASPMVRDRLSATDRRAATAAVRRFLIGYLPYLYGRAPASRVESITPSVAQALRAGTARTTPAQQRRQPRATAVKLTGQTAHSALAVVQIVDGGPAAFQLTLTVELRGGRWVISDLGDDG